VEQELKGIRYQSRTYAKLETLMNRVNEGSIKEEHRRQEQNKAVGVDGITKGTYGEKLDGNVADLIDRMKKFSYRPQPVRRAYCSCHAILSGDRRGPVSGFSRMSCPSLEKRKGEPQPILPFLMF
jgi:hypothetical protein